MATETIKRGNMRVGFETIRDDMQQLTEDFREIVQTFGEKSKDVIMEGGQKARSALRTWSESAKDRASDAYDHISSRGKEAVEKSRKRIALRPITFVFAALAAGMTLGAIFKSFK